MPPPKKKQALCNILLREMNGKYCLNKALLIGEYLYGGTFNSHPVLKTWFIFVCFGASGLFLTILAVFAIFVFLITHCYPTPPKFD